MTPSDRLGWRRVRVSLSASLFSAYGGGYVGIDAMFSLLWGRELGDGQIPDFAGAPTPHPLSNVIGVGLSPLGSASPSGLVAISFLSVGVLTYATWLVATALAPSSRPSAQPQ